jgi:tripartite-type tricarboxylate transporter receptor subunit TctC
MHSGEKKAMASRLIALLAGLTVAMTVGAAAQPYPTKSIRIVVPFAVGGATDIVARLAADPLEKRLGQQVIVENKVGAAGNIGAKQVAEAAPDGHTILYTSASILANTSLYQNPGYRMSQLTPIMIAGTNCSVVVAHPSTAINTLDELVVKAQSTPLTYGTAGVGSGPHIAGEALFGAIAKVKIKHIPYTGAAPALTAVLGNQVPVGFLALATGGVVELIQGGKLNALAITCDKRADALPNVPTVLETKYAALGTVSNWGAFFVPANTPKDVVTRLHRELTTIFQNEPVKSRIAEMGSLWAPQSLEEVDRQVKQEAAVWDNRIKQIGLKPQ